MKLEKPQPFPRKPPSPSERVGTATGKIIQPSKGGNNMGPPSSVLGKFRELQELKEKAKKKEQEIIQKRHRFYKSLDDQQSEHKRQVQEEAKHREDGESRLKAKVWIQNPSKTFERNAIKIQSIARGFLVRKVFSLLTKVQASVKLKAKAVSKSIGEEQAPKNVTSWSPSKIERMSLMNPIAKDMAEKLEITWIEEEEYSSAEEKSQESEEILEEIFEEEEEVVEEEVVVEEEEEWEELSQGQESADDLPPGFQSEDDISVEYVSESDMSVEYEEEIELQESADLASLETLSHENAYNNATASISQKSGAAGQDSDDTNRVHMEKWLASSVRREKSAALSEGDKETKWIIPSSNSKYDEGSEKIQSRKATSGLKAPTNDNSDLDSWLMPSKITNNRIHVDGDDSRAQRRDCRYSYITSGETATATSYGEKVKDRCLNIEDNILKESSWAPPKKKTANENDDSTATTLALSRSTEETTTSWMPEAILATEEASVGSSDTNDSWVPQSSKPKPRSRRIDFTGVLVEEKASSWVPAPSRRRTKAKSGEKITDELNVDSSLSNEVCSTEETSGATDPFDLESSGRSPVTDANLDINSPHKNAPAPPRKKTDASRKAKQVDGQRSRDQDTSQTTKHIRLLVLFCLLLVLPAALLSAFFLVRDNNSTNSDPTEAPDDDLITLLSSALSDSGESLKDSSSPQYAALQWLRTPGNNEIYSHQRLFQRYALATLYFSMGGENWDLSGSWLTNTTECEWFSVGQYPICDTAGFIVEIDLAGNNLRGQLPRDFEVLSNSLGKNSGVVVIQNVG